MRARARILHEPTQPKATPQGICAEKLASPTKSGSSGFTFFKEICLEKETHGKDYFSKLGEMISLKWQ
jgi:hypothetical protein